MSYAWTYIWCGHLRNAAHVANLDVSMQPIWLHVALGKIWMMVWIVEWLIRPLNFPSPNHHTSHIHLSKSSCFSHILPITGLDNSSPAMAWIHSIYAGCIERMFVSALTTVISALHCGIPEPSLCWKTRVYYICITSAYPSRLSPIKMSFAWCM